MKQQNQTPRAHRLAPLGAVSAGLLAGLLVALTAAPAGAATVLARADATAAMVSAGGQSTGTGTYAVTRTAAGESSTGANRPVVSALTGQSFLSAGVLAQDATTKLSGRAGTSAACAGLAGRGATVAQAGDGACLTPGETLSLQAGSLDLSRLRIVESTVLQGLDQQAQDALRPVLGPVLSGLQTALQTGLSQLGDPGVFLDLGAAQSRCTAQPGTATGDVELAGVGAYARVAGRRVDLLSLPVHPAPNTHVATNLSAVAEAVEAALRDQLSSSLDGSLSGLGAVVDRAEVLNGVLAQLGAQLAPLEQNVLDATLNAQVRKGADAVEVTALDLKVLPAAAGFGFEPLAVRIGRSACGPADRLAPVAKPAPAAPPARPRAAPRLPTTVSAGLAHGDGPADSPSRRAALGLAALLAVAATAGLADYRRRLRRAGR